MLGFAIAATLIIFWIHSNIVKISEASAGWGFYGKAVGVIILVSLLVWLAVAVIRKWRAKPAANSTPATPAQPATTAKPKRSFLGILVWILLILSAAGFLFVFGSRYLSKANDQPAVCSSNEAWVPTIHKGDGIDYFVVEFQGENCFGPRMSFPKSWQGKVLHYQPEGDHPDQEWFMSFWSEGEIAPLGPFRWFKKEWPWFPREYSDRAFRLKGIPGQKIRWWVSKPETE